MKKLSTYAIGLSLVGLALSHTGRAAEVCGTITATGASCADLKLQVDVKGCGDEGAASAPHLECKDGKASAKFSTAGNSYRATLQLDSSAWGEASWKVQSLDKQAKVVATKKAKPVAVTKHVVRELASPQVVPLPPVEKVESPQIGDGRLLGGMGSLRARLAKAGITITPNYSGEYDRITSGGIEQAGTYMGKFNLGLDQDLEQGLGWKGGAAHLIFLGTHGTGPSRYAGDSQASSNIETIPTFRVYEAWLKQSFADNSVSILGGLYDINSEFYVTNTSLVFLNSSFGIGKEVSQAPVNAGNSPSIYPIPSFGGRLRVEPNPNFYLMTAVMDGVAGDPNDPYGTHVLLDRNDGLFIVTEAAYVRGTEPKSSDSYGKYALGYWTYTQPMDSIQPYDSGIEKRTSHGFYALMEQTIADDLAAFARFGTAAKDVNQFRYNFSAGVVYTHPFWGNDQIGFGVTSAIVGSDYKDSQTAAGTPVSNSETTYEFLYRFEVVPGFNLQPDFQFISNPSADPTVPNASVFSLRFDLLL